MPRVSVCVPVYNGMPYILETLRSVRAQTYTDWELVVTDNGSMDDSVAKVREELERNPDPRVRFVGFPSANGLAKDWNRVVDLGSGELVKILPCDDVLRADCLARQVDALTASPEAGFVASSRRIIDASGKVRLAGRQRRGNTIDLRAGRKAMLAGGHNPLGEPACLLVRRAIGDVAGWFDPRFRYYPDLDFVYRCLKHAPGVRINEALCDFRIHGGSQTSARQKDYIAEYVALLDHHGDSVRPTRWERGLATIRARVVARARAAVIRWILRTEGR